MTYRQAFDHLGRPHDFKAHRQRVYRAALRRWMLTVALVLLWALTTGWLDMPK